MPYLVWNTVFDNTRVTTELDRKPVPFSQYSFPLLKFSRENNFSYQVPGLARRRGRFRRMMDFFLRGLGQRHDRIVQSRLDAGQRQAPGSRERN